MYAVIEDSGTQIKVAEGDVIDIDTRDLADDQAEITFDRVLFVGGDKPQIGAPLVDGAKVTADILEEGRTKKIDIVKFKRRKDYRRRNGHRQDFIRVKVTGIKA